MSQYEQYAVGFVRSSPQIGNETCAYHCGSGTLVNVGGVHGILTAGHVLNEIKRDGHFVMLSATGPGQHAHAHKVEIEPGSIIMNWSGEASRLGPDIGFIRLPNKMRDWARENLAFYNYARRYQLYVDGKKPEPTEGYYVFGSLKEGSEIALQEDGFNGLKTNFGFFTGELVVDDLALHEAGSFIFLPGESASNPESFEGLSGSGLWAVNALEGPMGHILIGVVYFQYEPISKGVRPLVFHSVDWTYNWLHDEVSKHFAGEFQPFDSTPSIKEIAV
jgi:hypothetical protein